MTFARHGHLPWLQIETCFRKWPLHVTLQIGFHVHVTVFFHGFKLKSVLGIGMCMIGFFSHCFESDPVSWDFMFMLQSFSMAWNWNDRPPWIQFGSCFRENHVQVKKIFHLFKSKTVSGDRMCLLRSVFIASSCIEVDLNWNVCLGMTCACYAHFPLITITLTNDFNKEFPVKSNVRVADKSLLLLTI